MLILFYTSNIKSMHQTKIGLHRVWGMGMDDFVVLWVWGFCGDWNSVPTTALRVISLIYQTRRNISNCFTWQWNTLWTR